MLLVVTLTGDTLESVCQALGRLAGCSLHHAVQLPHQAALQPQGWLADCCVCYHDGASSTLWVGLALSLVPHAAAQAVLSREEARDCEAAVTRALLLLFLTSHAVLWVQPERALASATSLMSQLRLLQQLKSALLPALPGLLGVEAQAASAAVPGLCVPRLLVLVQPSGPQLAGQAQQGRAELAAGKEAGEARHPLDTLLKRCRVLAGDDGSARALCTLPPSGSVLLRLPAALGSGSQEQLIAEALAELLPAQQGSQPPPAPARQASPVAVVAAALAPVRAAVAALSAGEADADVLLSWRQAVASLAAVLEAAATPSTSSLSLAATAGAAAVSRDVAVPAEAAAAAAWQSACSRAAWDFSATSCKRAAAVASDAYRRNTPTLLPAAGHAVALQAALRLYRSLARGPAAAAGAEALQQQLDVYWRDGHMQCDAVSFLGNPCCLPAHDPQQQPHSSTGAGTSGAPVAGQPQLLLASGSGAQQHAIPEPFTAAELQRAAAAVASESGAAAARAQLHVRRLAGAVAGQGLAAGPAVVGGHLGEGMPAAGPQQPGYAAAGPAELAAVEEDLAADLAADQGGRGQLSGDGPASGDVEGPGDGAAATSALASAPANSAGLPAAGCYLELHVLGPRREYKSPALAAALLLDGQPGWLRAGGVTLAALTVQVAVPLKPGQQQQQQAAVQAAAEDQPLQEDFPSLEQVREREQQRQQQRRSPAKKRQQRGQQAAGEAAQASEQGGASPGTQAPALLSWPGWQPATAQPTAAQRAPLFVASSRDARRQQQQQRGAKQRGSRLAAGAAAPAAAAPVPDAGPAASAAAAVAAGTAAVEQATVLLGVEYETVQGQRLLLTPALLAAALQSSLDVVSVRQQQQQPPAAGAAAATGSAAPGPKTAAAAAAAAKMPQQASAAFLLQQDLPLWLQLPGSQLARLAGSAKRRTALPGAADAAAAASGSGGERPVWLQLRRLLVGTPDAAVPLEAAPKLQLEVPAPMLAPPPAPGTPGATTAGPAGPAGVGTTVQLEYSPPSPLLLPSGSFCVLALPWLLTSPASLASSPAAAAGNASGGPAALIRPSGPLRAVLAGCSMLRPAGTPA